MNLFEYCGLLELQASRTHLPSSFWISNLILSLVWQWQVRRAFAEAASRRQGQNSVAFPKAHPPAGGCGANTTLNLHVSCDSK